MLLSIVIPVYNETESLPALLQTLNSVLPGMNCDYEIVFVDDGSKDNTLGFLTQAAAQDRRIKTVKFSRNFGHQVAVTAGLGLAGGDAVGVGEGGPPDSPEPLAKK